MDSAKGSVTTMKKLTHYFDYKSPYAFLAQADTLALSKSFEVEVEILPYTLDIPSYLGRAEVDDRGAVVASERNAHQWRRVRYSYMDCRREANRRGLVIRGTRKIFDSTIAHLGYLFARRQGDPFAYHDVVFQKFWRRELDIEDISAVAKTLSDAGICSTGFEAYTRSEGRGELNLVHTAAEAKGVFGVPTYLIDDQLYWGHERLERVMEHLERRG